MLRILPARHPVALWGALGVAVFALLFARSMSRFFDLDEHQFVAPPLLLWRGLRPYVDYPYFHMPYLVYVYAALLWLAPYKLLLARTLSVVCATATAAVLFRTGWSRLSDLEARWRWLIVGGLVATFLCSRLFTFTSGWAWNHDTAVLAILLCYLVHRHGLRSGDPRFFLLSGALFGVATCIRLSIAPAALPLAASLVVPALGASGKTWRKRLAAVAYFGLGGLVASLPGLALMYEVPERFFFGNVTYARYYGAFAQATSVTAITPLGKIGYLVTTAVSDPGNLLLFGLASVWLVRLPRRWRGGAADQLLLACLLAALWLGAMAPTKAHYQYNYVLLPFIVIAGWETIAADRGDPVRFVRWCRIVGIGTAITVVTGLPRWYWGLINLASPQAWVPVQVHATGVWVDGQLPPGARVMTIDPLIALEGGRDVYPQFATGRLVFNVGSFISAADRRKFDMAFGSELAALMEREPPGAFLYDVGLEILVPDFVAYARAHGFRSIDLPDGDYRLWVGLAADALPR
jgi:hypothetical protein